jgi:hypothetical protein
VRAARWIPAVDALLFVLEVVVLVRLFTVHPPGEGGYDGALRVAGQTLIGFFISGLALGFGAATRGALRMQSWFALLSLLTTLGWGFLFLLASVDV